MYKHKNFNFESFDDYRYFTYNHAATWTSFDNLPPTSKSIRLHILRAFYATYYQIHCLNTQITELNPISFGYKKDGDDLIPERIENIFPTTEELVPACKCVKCSTKSCSCVAAGIPCCSFCSCKKANTCKNVKYDDNDDDSTSDS